MTEYKDILTKTKSENSKSIDEPESFGRFIGTSPAMQKLYDLITKAAPHHTPVFITGETGTGKEICAQSLHSYSSCHQGPFIALNCAALPLELAESALFGHVKGAFTGAHSNRAGAIAKAEGGSLFLDEICDMPLALQSKLLRFCQDYTYRSVGSDQPKRANIRIICATNRDPLAQIKKGKFREDLYYRLHIIPIAMPPLRKR
ncbi:MAG: sigma-54 factor interaction domain-containing protein, partial [Alphaproteobacteria bacterium]|nr:sigma-54 factor interaction domain-containing protein [Alphaproteobacteria bacterium]